VSLGVFHSPEAKNVQETRGGISRHARIGGSYGLENRCCGARRRHFDYGERFFAITDAPVEKRLITVADRAVQKRLITVTDAPLLIVERFRRK
jgi:hypothetical protein